VAFQRVSPFVSLICMLPERSIRKSTLPAAGCAGYVPVALGQIGAAPSACVIGGGFRASWSLFGGAGGPFPGSDPQAKRTSPKHAKTRENCLCRIMWARVYNNRAP